MASKSLGSLEIPDVFSMYIPRELISCHGQTDHPLW